MRRLTTLLLLTMVALSFAAAPSQAASRPTISDISGTFDLGNVNLGPTGAVCDFPVGVVISAPHLLQISFNGQPTGYAAFQRGHITATVTNLDTNESIAVNISGPTNLDVTGSGAPTKGTGGWLLFEPIAQGGLRFIHGNISFQVVSYGVHGIVNGGTEQDLCARLEA
jgi:hypothetical protein